MYQSIITFNCQAFDTEERLTPVFDLLDAWEGFVPLDYDLNQMEQWRTWDRERALVDALTQRTQLFRVRGEGGALAMVAMGKHGEPPTLIISVDSESEEAAKRPWRHVPDDLASVTLG
jgi:hypothetical protein